MRRRIGLDLLGQELGQVLRLGLDLCLTGGRGGTRTGRLLRTAHRMLLIWARERSPTATDRQPGSFPATEDREGDAVPAVLAEVQGVATTTIGVVVAVAVEVVAQRQAGGAEGVDVQRRPPPAPL